MRTLSSSTKRAMTGRFVFAFERVMCVNFVWRSTQQALQRDLLVRVIVVSSLFIIINTNATRLTKKKDELRATGTSFCPLFAIDATNAVALRNLTTKDALDKVGSAEPRRRRAYFALMRFDVVWRVERVRDSVEESGFRVRQQHRHCCRTTDAVVNGYNSFHCHVRYWHHPFYDFYYNFRHRRLQQHRQELRKVLV